MSFDLLLTERLGQQVHHILYGVSSLHFDELLLEVFTYDVEPPLYMLGLLVRSGLLSEGYSTVVVIVQCNDIRWHHTQLCNKLLKSKCFLSSFRGGDVLNYYGRISNDRLIETFSTNRTTITQENTSQCILSIIDISHKV